MDIKLKITEEEINEIFKKDILKHMRQTIRDSNLEYWVRKKVHDKLADKIVSQIIEKHFTENEIRNILKEAIKRYVDERYE